MSEDVVNNGIGLVTGTSTAVNFPNVGCQIVRFKAHPANAEVVYLGTSASHMWPLSAGNDTDWVDADNLSDFWYKGGTGSVNRLHFWTQ